MIVLESLQEAVLRFRVQEDGRRVARLPSGKVVLVDVEERERVEDGSWWRVHLVDKVSFVVAKLVAPSVEEEATTSPALQERRPPGARPTPEGATLRFRVQEDGRRVARLPSGKVAIVAADEAGRVEDGAWWDVQLEDRGNFEVARLVGPARPQVPAESLPRADPVRPSDVVQSGDRVALFVDGTRASGSFGGFFIDWRKARAWAVAQGRSGPAFYYHRTEDPAAEAPFLDFLAHAGYVVRARPRDLDVDLAVDLADTSKTWDVAFVVGAFSGLERALETVRARGKRVHVVAARGGTPRDLALVADKPLLDLADHGEDLAREERRVV